MSLMTDFFTAPSDKAAAALVEHGPAPDGREGPDWVQSKNLEPTVVMGTLEAILTGRDFEDILDDPQTGQTVAGEGCEDGPWVVVVSDALQQALASADETQLTEAVHKWVRTEEMSQSRPSFRS